MADKQSRERREIRYTDAQKIAKRQIESQTQGGCLRIPEGMVQYELGKAGLYEWNIIPYIVGKNAKVIDPDCEPGDIHYELTYKRHTGVGPEEKTVVCLTTFGERCPLCERHLAFRKTMNWDSEEEKKMSDNMRAKERTVFIVEDANPRGKRQMEIFEYATFGFATPLREVVNHPKAKERGWNRFFHLKGGMTVEVMMEPSTISKDWLKASTVTLTPRAKDLPESYLDEAPCLDEMLVRLTREQIIRLADGGEPVVETATPAQINGRNRISSSVSGPHLDSRDEDRPIKRNPRDEDDDRPVRRRDEDEDEGNPAARMGIEEGNFVSYKRMRCEVIRLNAEGTKADIRDEDSGERFKGIPVADLKVDGDDDDKPVRRKDDDEDDRPVKRTGRSRDEDDNDEDDDKGWRGRDKEPPEEEEVKEEPTPKKRGPGRPRKDAK
jgi:hypothetical protein